MNIRFYLIFSNYLAKTTTHPNLLPTPAAVGEPPVVMAAAAVFAIKHCIEAARAEIGRTDFFPLSESFSF